MRMEFETCALCVILALGYVPVKADIQLISPKEGETVEQLWPEVKAFWDSPREVREHHAENLSKRAKQGFHRFAGAKPVEFRWTGDKNGVYVLKVERMPDGKVFVGDRRGSAHGEYVGVNMSLHVKSLCDIQRAE